MPAKTRISNVPSPKPAAAPPEPVQVTPEPVVPADPSLFPPVAEVSPGVEPSLRLSPVEEAVVSPISQLASLSTNPEPSSPFPILPSTPPPRSRVWIFVIIALTAGITVAGLAIFRVISGYPQSAKVSVVVTTPVPSIAPTSIPTPSISLNRKDLKLQVLNGTGIAGLAGKAKSYLENLGYVNITTGNDDSYSNSTTQISLTAASSAFLPLLTSDLKANYTLSDKVATLSASSPYDAVITLGQK